MAKGIVFADFANKLELELELSVCHLTALLATTCLKRPLNVDCNGRIR